MLKELEADELIIRKKYPRFRLRLRKRSMLPPRALFMPLDLFPHPGMCYKLINYNIR